MGFTARGLLPTLDGGPMRRSLRAHSRPGTAPISGLLPCWLRVSAVSEQGSTSLQQSSACAALAWLSEKYPCWHGSISWWAGWFFFAYPQSERHRSCFLSIAIL